MTRAFFGLKLKDQMGEIPATVPTGWMSNSPTIFNKVGRRSGGKPEHHVHALFIVCDVHVAETYLLRLPDAILTGLRDHLPMH